MCIDYVCDSSKRICVIYLFIYIFFLEKTLNISLFIFLNLENKIYFLKKYTNV